MDDIQKVADALNANNIECIVVQSKAEALEQALELIPKGAEVGLGGSVSVEQIGLLEKLRGGDYTLHDQYEEGIEMDENLSRRRKGLVAKYFVTGTNAITEDGKIVNTDGLGNRLAGLCFGPSKVIIVAGRNKIVREAATKALASER